ncbi:hypothetical protein SCOCK_30370 [Actinacidiphila cocklensis]|uniref:Uncharacterized protein n=1 Tax=Actinacidiphila cocklensis TaxID=887465 RepID=A0A9W4GRV0_9ACTN|nr:hypothetical protein SCOCK_30370 [Actinacidiphila cocklensis]
MEDVLEPHRRRHARGARPELPLRLRAQPRHRRRPVDRVLPRRRHGRRHRHGLLRPAVGRGLLRAGQAAVRAPGPGRLRGRARQAGLVPGVGAVQKRRQPAVHRGHAAVDERPQGALPDRHGLLPARRVAVLGEPEVVGGLPLDALRPQHPPRARGDTHGDADVHCAAYAYAYAYGDGDIYADAWYDADPDADAYCDADAHCQADASCEAEPGRHQADEADDRTHRRADQARPVRDARAAAGGRSRAEAVLPCRGVPAASADRGDEEAVRERRGVLPPHPEAGEAVEAVEADRLTRALPPRRRVTPAAPAGRSAGHARP